MPAVPFPNITVMMQSDLVGAAAAAAGEHEDYREWGRRGTSSRSEIIGLATWNFLAEYADRGGIPHELLPRRDALRNEGVDVLCEVPIYDYQGPKVADTESEDGWPTGRTVGGRDPGERDDPVQRAYLRGSDL